MKIRLLLLIFLFAVAVFAQSNEKCACSKKDKSKIREYFANLENQRKQIAECEVQTTLQLTRPPLVIAAKCEFGGSGCPVYLAIPKFPQTAKKLKLSGAVDVEIIIDEEGKVIYSKMIEGNEIFKESAEKAACKARFTPVSHCGKPYKTALIIRYNFLK